MSLSDFLRPAVEHPMFQHLITSAETKGITIEMLLGIAVGFLIFLVYLLFIMSNGSGPIALSAEEYQPFELTEIEQISPDTKRLRFALQSPLHVLGLPTGQHISFRCKAKDGSDIIRSYTPITSNDEVGYVDFVIKVYFPDVHPKFPDGGAMTMHLEGLKVGDTVDMRGPKGHMDYTGCGKYSISRMNMKTGKRSMEQYNNKRFGFIAGGSGITPCLQVIREMLKIPNDHSDISLLYANQTEKDILLRTELDSMAKEHADRFRVHYTLDNPPKRGWKGSKGFIDTEMCEKSLPEAGDDAFIFICGPPPMIKFAVEPALKEMGYDAAQWFAF
jgi:cytochrome-b5 reductase